MVPDNHDKHGKCPMDIDLRHVQFVRTIISVYSINLLMIYVPRISVADPVAAPSPSVASPPMKLAVPKATLWFAWLEWTSLRSILRFQPDLLKEV
jgi:hypothetical protein